ncbi:OmpA family protein [Aquicoccus sp. SCR17]|nr:OmpA family protein [Carideicomes alvinocaridis]
MRLSNFALPVLTFVAAAVLSTVAAGFSVTMIEDASVEQVEAALEREGLGWAEADANGLQLYLIGTAPNEAQRFRALSVAGRVVDAARILDQMNVEETADLAPPRFSIEILRNEAGVSLIGLVPAGTAREDLVAEVEEIAGSEEVSDLLDTADFPSPEGWDEAVDFALDTLQTLPRSKISVAADRVAVTAMTESEEERREAQAHLNRQVPDGVRLALDLSAPRPVITPFTLRFTSEGERGPRFDACSADSDEARDRILSAAREAGLEGQASCRIGLGVPSTNWAKAAELAIGAVAELGGGSVTFSDADVKLVAAEGTDQALFDRVAGELDSALPEVFALDAVLPVSPEQQAGPSGPPEFTATLSPEGALQLRGRLASEMARETAESYAEARFGSQVVHMAARLQEDLPADWQVRVLSGLEALSWLENGTLRVTEDEIAVTGDTGQQEASDEIARILADKLGESGVTFAIDVTYQEKLDPVASMPTPEECEATIAEIVKGRKINFEPGSANPDQQSGEILDDIAEVLKQCGDLRLEIQGHTDSQGREEMNQRLSQQRAEAVLSELRERRILTSSFTAKGYGEAEPIADNGTEAGRDANRRIEFKLIPAESVDGDETGAETGDEPEDGAEAAATEEETALESDGQSVEEDDADLTADDGSGDAEDSGSTDETDEQN